MVPARREGIYLSLPAGRTNDAILRARRCPP